MITGWYDHCATGSVDFFMQTMRYASKSKKRNTHLIIGPWTHSAEVDIRGEYDFGPHAGLDRSIIDAFFEHHLKENPPQEPFAPVKIFVMGRNEWRHEREWPLSRAIDTNFISIVTGMFAGHGSGAAYPIIRRGKKIRIALPMTRQTGADLGRSQ